MAETMCGVDCASCFLKDSCGGCSETGGRPFGGDCVVAKCCSSKNLKRCGACSDAPCNLKSRLIAEFNALGIRDAEPLTDLNALRGVYLNLEYAFPNGQTVKFLDDNKIYFGNQLPKKGSSRYYGVAADETFLLVSEYGENGADAEVVFYKNRI